MLAQPRIDPNTSPAPITFKFLEKIENTQLPSIVMFLEVSTLTPYLTKSKRMLLAKVILEELKN